MMRNGKEEKIVFMASPDRDDPSQFRFSYMGNGFGSSISPEAFHMLETMHGDAEFSKGYTPGKSFIPRFGEPVQELTKEDLARYAGPEGEALIQREAQYPANNSGRFLHGGLIHRQEQQNFQRSMQVFKELSDRGMIGYDSSTGSNLNQNDIALKPTGGVPISPSKLGLPAARQASAGMASLRSFPSVE